MAEEQQVTPTMTMDQLSAYRDELRDELAELEHSYSVHPSKYKADRIKRLRTRLELPTH